MKIENTVAGVAEHVQPVVVDQVGAGDDVVHDERDQESAPRDESPRWPWGRVVVLDVEGPGNVNEDS